MLVCKTSGGKYGDGSTREYNTHSRRRIGETNDPTELNVEHERWLRCSIVPKATQEKALITATPVSLEGRCSEHTEAKVIDGTKGYPGEGPPREQDGATKSSKHKKKPKLNRKNKTKKLNLRTLWGTAMETWKNYRGWGTTQLEICMKEMTCSTTRHTHK